MPCSTCDSTRSATGEIRLDKVARHALDAMGRAVPRKGRNVSTLLGRAERQGGLDHQVDRLLSIAHLADDLELLIDKRAPQGSPDYRLVVDQHDPDRFGLFVGAASLGQAEHLPREMLPRRP